MTWQYVFNLVMTHPPKKLCSQLRCFSFVIAVGLSFLLSIFHHTGSPNLFYDRGRLCKDDDQRGMNRLLLHSTALPSAALTFVHSCSTILSPPGSGNLLIVKAQRILFFTSKECSAGFSALP